MAMYRLEQHPINLLTCISDVTTLHNATKAQAKSDIVSLQH